MPHSPEIVPQIVSKRAQVAPRDGTRDWPIPRGLPGEARQPMLSAESPLLDDPGKRQIGRDSITATDLDVGRPTGESNQSAVPAAGILGTGRLWHLQ